MSESSSGGLRTGAETGDNGMSLRGTPLHSLVHSRRGCGWGGEHRAKKDKDLTKWWARYCESTGDLEKATECYTTANDYMALVCAAGIVGAPALWPRPHCEGIYLHERAFATNLLTN